MPVGAWSTRAVAVALVIAGCGDDHAPARTPLERAIETALTARLGIPVCAHCEGTACGAMAFDGTLIPISVTTTGRELEWRVDGFLVASDALEAYVKEELSDLGASQGVTCARRIRRVVAGERITCTLERGGRVFVTLRADGSLSLETLLDPAAAKLRDELVTPELEEELARASRALEDSEAGDEASEEPGPAGELLAPDAAR